LVKYNETSAPGAPTSNHNVVDQRRTVSMSRGFLREAEAADLTGASDNVVCDAVVLSLCVLRLDRQWHAGVLDANAAMSALNNTVDRIVARRGDRRPEENRLQEFDGRTPRRATRPETSMLPPLDDARLRVIATSQSSEDAQALWEQMMADSFAHLTEAQKVVEELAKGVVGPGSAAMPCIEASHSVAVALVALAEAARCAPSRKEMQMGKVRPVWP
jgi:hypothetical protein